MLCKLGLKVYLSAIARLKSSLNPYLEHPHSILMNIRFLFIAILFCNPVVAQQPSLPTLRQSLQTSKADTSKVSAYGAMADYYFYINADSAAHYANEGRKLAHKINDKLGEGDMIAKIASLRENHGNLALTEKLYNDALVLYKQVNAQKRIAEVMNGMGVSEAKNGDFSAANEHFIAALKIYDDLKDEKGIAHTYLKLGALSGTMGEFDKALVYYDKCKAFYKDKPISENTITLYNNIGIIYAQKDSLPEALKLFLEGIALSDSAQFAGVHIMLLTNAGNAYEQMGMPKEAKTYIGTALSKARQYKMRETEARSLLNFATLYESTNPAACEKYLDTAITVAKAIDHKLLIAEIYGARGEFFKGQKKYKEALEAFEQKTHLSDSLVSVEKATQIAAIQADYQTEEANFQINQLKLTNAKTRLERNIGIAITLAAIIILAALTYFFIRLRVINKKLNEANQIRSKLFSIIGHDLKGPMTSQAEALDTLKEHEFPAEKQKEIIQELSKQSASTLNILNDLLTWGNAQLQGVKVNPTTFYARPTIAKTVSLYAKQVDTKAISIHNNIPDGTSVFVDPDHFDYVMRNLISNAIKFTPRHGGIAITVSNEPIDDLITFSITDTGKGISSEEQKAFMEGNGSMKVSYGIDGEKGTGLGLMLAKEFIISNNGKIWCASQEGKGTTFFISLPKAG